MADKDWKAEYETLAAEFEARADADKVMSELLTRTIIRLTLAANGLDEQLDPHLKKIRDAVRGGVNQALKERLDKLSDSLMHFSESEQPDEAESAPLDISPLLDQLSVKKSHHTEIMELFDQLQSERSDMPIERIARLATLICPESHTKAGLIGRLFGSTGAQHETHVDPNRHLLTLLQQVEWPGHWMREIDAMKSQLNRADEDEIWVGVLRQLLDLSAKSYDEAKAEIKETEDFLSQLTLRLQDLDDHFKRASLNRNTEFNNSRQFSDQVSGEMAGLASSVDSATDLDQLKQDINQRISTIRSTLDGFVAQENRWYEEAEQQESDLRERLKQLEAESYDMRKRLLEAHHLALLDPVTQLPNRMAYDERVAQEYARWKRFNEPIALIMWDVDDFKPINDRFGHQAGDKALGIIAQSLRNRIRESDFIARYGGEEFVTLLFGVEAQQAHEVAEQMRTAVENCGFHSGNKQIAITISCGIALFAPGDDIESVVKRADEALYQSKKAGKNRCTLSQS